MRCISALFRSEKSRSCKLSLKMAFNLNKVLISDEVDQKCVDILQENGVEVTKNTKLSKTELIAEIPKYDGLVVRSSTKATADVISAGKNLKIIGRAGTGVDNIDCNAATKHGIIVMNTPGGNTLSAAEHTCTLLLAMSRHVARGNMTLTEGKWERKPLLGNEVYGKTLGIIGLGRIGKEVATRMQSFGMRTIGYDPIIPGEVSAEFDVEWMELEKMWPQVDYITVHVPLIPPTKNMINDEVFSKCKKGVRVINCARGGIIDEDALLRALQSGQCGGAALDVFVQEPPTSLELIKHPLVTATPHLGASTTEAQNRVAKEIAEQFIDVKQGKSLFGAINAQAMTNALTPDTRPWVELGSALGRLAVSLLGQVNSQTQLQVTTQGSTLSNAGQYLQAAALVGLLKNQSSNGLNLISAPALAKDNNIKITSQHQEGESDSVSLSVTQPGCAATSLTGTVAAGQPQLLAVANATFALGVTLRGGIVLYKSQNNPQNFPAVTAALAGAGVSVLSFSSTKPCDGSLWNVLQISPAASNTLDVIKPHTEVAYQIAF